MGKKRTAVIGESTNEPKKKVIFRWEKAYADLSETAAEALRNARIKPDQLITMADGEVLTVEGITPALLEEIRKVYPAQLVAEEKAPEIKKTDKEVVPEVKKGTSPKLKRPRYQFGRSKRHQASAAKAGTKAVETVAAVELLKTTAYSKHKTVELHLTVREAGIRGEVSLPHSVGKQIKVVIFDDQVESEIKAGKIDFDILLATPADMPKVAPLAKVLGPRGLMPNPKNGTVTDKPQERAKHLQEGATLSYRTEPKAPLIHLVIGNLNQPNQELVENINVIINAIGLTRIKTATLKSTMSPGIHLLLA